MRRRRRGTAGRSTEREARGPSFDLALAVALLAAKYSDEFKREAVELLRSGDRTLPVLETGAAALRGAICAEARALGLLGVARSVEVFAATNAPGR